MLLPETVKISPTLADLQEFLTQAMGWRPRLLYPRTFDGDFFLLIYIIRFVSATAISSMLQEALVSVKINM